MSSLESQLAFARVVTTLAEQMNPDQRREAAAAIRALPGDAISREFFASVAGGLDTFADQTDAP